MFFENNHEPIIDRSTWETVQRIRGNTKRRQPKKSHRNMFSGLLYCADCSSKLHYNVNHLNSEIEYFNCSNYRGNRGTCNSTHYVRVDSLEKVVLLELNRITSFVRRYEEEFVKILIDKTLRDMQSENRRFEQEFTVMIARDRELDNLFNHMYEDNLSGKISDDRFLQMSKQYTDEQEALKKKIVVLQKEVKKEKRHTTDADGFLAIVRKYTEIGELNPSIVNELVEKIVVHHAEKLGKERVQRIEIYYNFIGMLDLPEMEAIPKQSIMADIRKGVSVRYTTGKAS